MRYLCYHIKHKLVQKEEKKNYFEILLEFLSSDLQMSKICCTFAVAKVIQQKKTIHTTIQS